MQEKQSDRQPNWVTRRELAGTLKRSTKTVDNLTRAGTLVAYKLPGSRGVLYDLNEVNSTMRAVTPDSGSTSG